MRTTDPNFNGGSAKTYRWVGFEWNTVLGYYSGADIDGQISMILGHNGPHLLSLAEGQALFQEWDVAANGWKPAYSVVPAGLSASVKNVTISSVKTNVNEDYFIYDPSEEAAAERKNPPFEFTINDGVNQGGYQVVIYMRETPNMTWPTNASGNFDGPWLACSTSNPGTYPLVWNGYKNNNDPLSPKIEEPCTYTFDIGVWETPTPNDWTGTQTVDDCQWMKYNYWLSIPENYTSGTQTKPGHAVKFVYDDATDKIKARISFYYDDYYVKDPSAMMVYLLDGSFTTKATYVQSPVQARVGYDDIDIHTLQDEDQPGTWRGIFTGWDDHRELRRDHECRRMVAVNDKRKILLGWYRRANFGFDHFKGITTDDMVEDAKNQQHIWMDPPVWSAADKAYLDSFWYGVPLPVTTAVGSEYRIDPQIDRTAHDVFMGLNDLEAMWQVHDAQGKPLTSVPGVFFYAGHGWDNDRSSALGGKLTGLIANALVCRGGKNYESLLATDYSDLVELTETEYAPAHVRYLCDLVNGPGKAPFQHVRLAVILACTQASHWDTDDVGAGCTPSLTFCSYLKYGVGVEHVVGFCTEVLEEVGRRWSKRFWRKVTKERAAHGDWTSPWSYQQPARKAEDETRTTFNNNTSLNLLPQWWQNWALDDGSEAAYRTVVVYE